MVIEASMGEAISWVPFLAAGTGKGDEAPGKTIAVRLAEVAMLLAFGAFWMNKLDARIETLGNQVSQLQIQVAILKTRDETHLRVAPHSSP